MFSNKAKHCRLNLVIVYVCVYITTEHTLIRRPTLFKTILFIFNSFIKPKNYPSELKIPGKIKAGTKTRDKSKPATKTRAD